MTKQRRKCCWNLPNVFCVFKSRKVPHTYFILIYIYTKPCNFLATGAGKWSVPQLDVIFNSRIPYSVGNKIQNHLFKTLSFASLFRVFTLVPEELSLVACPHNLFHSLPIPRRAGFAVPLYFPVLLDPALPPSLPEGDSNFKEPQGWHQKSKQRSLKECSHQIPDMAMTGPAALPQENWGGEETTPGLEKKLLHIKVRQNLLFLWGYWFERIFSFQVCSAFPSPQLLPGAVLGTIYL